MLSVPLGRGSTASADSPVLWPDPCVDEVDAPPAGGLVCSKVLSVGMERCLVARHVLSPRRVERTTIVRAQTLSTLCSGCGCGGGWFGGRRVSRGV